MLKYSVSELLRLNSFAIPRCISVLKQLRLLRRPPYIHRGAGRTFVYTESAIPSFWSVASRSRHQSADTRPCCHGNPSPLHTQPPTHTDRHTHGRQNGKRGTDSSLLRPLKQIIPTKKSIKMELFNVQSLTNKSSFIHAHILENDLDLLCLTETWHRPNSFPALNAACPAGYTYLEAARNTGRGGGLSVIFRKDLDLSQFPLPELTSFECLGFKTKPPTPMTTLLIYRPPKPNPNFIPDLTSLLSTFCPTSSHIMLLGDLNIHVDSPSCRVAAEFNQLLDCFNLRQHVSVPTHSRGHTLDLVITDSSFPLNLAVHDLGVSDHLAVSLDLSHLSPHHGAKRQITFRNLKTIDPNILASDLHHHLSAPLLPPPSLNKSVDLYNQTLSSLLDLHAPMRSRTVAFSRSAPWYNSELREMKTAGRSLERKYISSGLTVHKQAFREHQKAYSMALKQARSSFFSGIIRSSPGNSKQLFATVQHLLSAPTPSNTDVTADRCNAFLDFFCNKISSIRSTFSSSPSPPCQTSEPAFVVSQPLCSFRPVSQQEIMEIIKAMKPTTCALDPFPSDLVKTNIPVLAPIITTITNQSLQSGSVPLQFKTAIIKPLLKKPTLDPNVLANHRPIANLPFISKALEKVSAGQLYDHLRSNNVLETFQSGFRPTHSTETALLRVINDLMMAADSGSPSLLVLLDLSAAFDTVDHKILLQRLSDIGLQDTALDWFQSYLTDRTEYVSIGEARSRTRPVTCGVPQGSVLGPILFNIYLSPLGQVIRRFGVSFHCYADDTQLYMRMNPHPSSSSPSPLSTLSLCLKEIKAWMNQNFLQLNDSKTEAILVGTPHQVHSSPLTSISLSGHDIPLSSTVTNLGVRFDPHLSFDSHVKHLCKTSYFHLKNIASIRSSLSARDAEKLVHAFISSRLDYCNSLLHGITNKNLQKLQSIQNSAARLLTHTKKHDHITPVLHSLHWLPVPARIQYKICLLTHQCIHGHAPPYLKDLLSPQTAERSLRPSGSSQLSVPRTKLATMGDRAFCSAAPRLWNSLPDHLRAPQTVDSFKKRLKTHLFRQFFDKD